MKLSCLSSRFTLPTAVLVTLSALLLGAPLPGTARPATTASSGLIAFTRADGIYAVHADGSGVHALRRGGVAAGAMGLAWSPDGRRIAFLAPAAGEIWVMNADGAELMRCVRTVGGAILSSPTWAPDSHRIAFATYRRGGGGGGIYVVNADGSNKTRLAKTPRLLVSALDWSPSGDRIAFQMGSYVTDVYVIDANGSNLRNLTHGRLSGSWEDPDWSQDGRRLVLQGKGDKIWLLDAGGHSLMRLTGGKVPDHDPVWSSDGGRIAFVRGALASRNLLEIYVINADGSGARRLTNNRIAEESPAWQPAASA
jgi:TolB protein